MTIAHVFWHGELTRYERASLQSIINSGFDVWFWSLDSYNLPPEVSAKDASAVVSADLVYAYTHEHWNEEWGSATESTSITFYSDILRYRLLQEYGGWWFDLDVICLKSREEFDALASSKRICIGWQDVEEGLCNNAVLCIPDKKIAAELTSSVQTLIDSKTTFYWGEIGPALLSEYLKENKLLDELMPRTTFYPNSIEPNVENIWKYEHDLTEAEHQALNLELKDAYVLHWYNNNLLLSDKQTSLPPDTSVIGRLFRAVGTY